MKKQFYELDSEGLIKEIYVLEVDENLNPINWNSLNRLISVEPPQGFYKLKWENGKWIEGESEEERKEREEKIFKESLKPSEEEISEAEFNVKVISLLMETGVL